MNVLAGNMRRIVRVWWFATARQASWAMASRLDFTFYILGKLVRMGFFFIFALALFHKTSFIAGFDTPQVILFFAVMNMIDVLTQMLWLRGFMFLVEYIRQGQFDMVLTQPLSPLVWATIGKFDVYDLLTLPASVWFVWYALSHLAIPPTSAEYALGATMFIVSLISMYAFSVICGALTFYMTETHNVWWMFRDLSYSARTPQEFFPRSVQLFFVFVIPIFTIIAFPARAVLGLLSWEQVAWAATVAVILFFGAHLFWRRALRQYSSVSS